MKKEVKKLHDEYKVSNSVYSISSYAFLNEFEFFAEMG